MNTNKKWLMKNKKAGEKWLSIWWIFVLVIIGGVIVIGVLVYYSADINIKEIEADILAERIVRCLVDNGYLRQDFVEEKEFDVFKECNLKREVFGKGSNYFFNISLKNERGNLYREDRKDIIEGDTSFEEDCGIEKTMRAKHYPRCSAKNGYLLYVNKEGKTEKVNLKILAGSNQEIKKTAVI